MPPTNLKERIAALEQKNSTSNVPKPPTPTPGSSPTSAGSPNALRDKIAKFEKKGGVPKPRGSFGLGAPPSSEGPRRNGELYGNRIPTQARNSSIMMPISRASSPTFSSAGDRRSFSLSSIMSDFDDTPEYTPISSPTFAFPPESPTSPIWTPDSSLSSNGDPPTLAKNIVRGTSFQKALEIARNAEMAKQESGDSTTPTGALRFANSDEVEAPELTPVIVVSSAGESSVVLSESPNIEPSSANTPVAELSLEAEVNQPNDEQAANLKTNASPKVELKSEKAKDSSPVKITSTSTSSLIPVLSKEVKTTESLKLTRKDSQASSRTVSSEKSLPSKDMTTSSIPKPLQVLPEIVVHNDASSNKTISSRQSRSSSRRASSIFKSKPLEESSVLSPILSSGNVSPATFSGVIGLEKQNGASEATTSPRQSLPSPMSPDAKLPYDEAEPHPLLDIKVPDPQAFLSPPPSGLQTGFSSGGTSLVSSNGSRPASMIETSPAHVGRALRMTPATGRGVPMFFPPTSSQPRKSDFVFFPPTPDADDNNNANEFGSVSLGADSSDSAKSSDYSTTLPNIRRNFVPSTPQVRIIQRESLAEPPSPGHGDLAALLHEAVMLEDTLSTGEFPFETARRLELEKRDEARSLAGLQARTKVEEERKNVASATAQLKAKDEPTPGLLKHTFLIPLSKAMLSHRKESTSPRKGNIVDKAEQDPIARPKSAGLPDKNAEPASGRKPASRPLTPESVVSKSITTTPPKSPKASLFVGFRRLGSMSRSNTVQAYAVRQNSISSEMSEDFPHPHLEFGAKNMSAGELSNATNNSTTSFPSMSSKKSSNGRRAASFAEKMWSRARTRSNGSILSTTGGGDRNGDDPSLQLPSFGPSLALELSSLDLVPEIEPPPSEIPRPVQRPPSAKRKYMPNIPRESIPQLPALASSTFNFHPLPERQISGAPNSSLTIPQTGDSMRTSWSSASSPGILPSPLFDQALYDAFPAIPGTTPSSNANNVATTANKASFDTALLSSAIHLASSNKAGAPASQASLQ